MPEAEFTPFLRAIHERPGDDLPRLIFADYLEERGDWRAPLLRRPPPPGIVSDFDATHAWRKWLGKMPRNSWASCRQGLLDVILPAAGAFELRDSHRLKEALREGWVEHLDIIDNEGQMPWAEQFDLTELPALGVQRADEETLERLPAMPELRRLHLNHCTASRAELGNLREFPKLEYVHIALTDAADDDLQRLPAVPHLQSLSIHGGSRPITTLGPIHELSGLRSLHLGQGFVDSNPYFDALPVLPNLQYLRIDQLVLTSWLDDAIHYPQLILLRFGCSVPPALLAALRRVRPEVRIMEC